MSTRWSILLCTGIALAIVLPRSLLVTSAHSESVDDEYHLDHGLCVLRGEHHPLTYNDPPLGEAILALPLYVVGVEPKRLKVRDSDGNVVSVRSVLYEQPYSPQTLRMLIAAWKAVLFVPGVVVAFLWSRRLYGNRSGWLAAAMLLIEPTIAAHTPIAALDVLAMEAVIVASYLVWRYLDRPGTGRLIGAGVATATAMLIKHSAIVLPPAIIALAMVHWFVRPWCRGDSISHLKSQIRPRINALASGAIVVLIAMWPLTLFDFSAPADAGRAPEVEYSDDNLLDDILLPALDSRWPAGIYIGSVFEAIQHGREGHSCFLWGEIREYGWWHYFFAVALYKLPIGIGLVLVLAVASLWRVKLKWDEIFIVVPMLACATLISWSGINVGFRHAMPAYGLLLILASRCVADGTGRAWTVGAWLGVILAAAHALSFHPDYIAYVNAPWKRPWLAIADSNLDWGQSLRQLNQWLEENPQDGRVVHFDGFDEPLEPAFSHFVRHKIRIVPRSAPTPTDGLLITSPSWLAGIYFRDGSYPHLQDVDPDAIIGHCLLVFDLDRLRLHGSVTRPAIE